MKMMRSEMRADAHEILEIADAVCHSCNTLLRALRHDDHPEYHYDQMRQQVMRMIQFELHADKRERDAKHADT